MNLQEETESVTMDPKTKRIQDSSVKMKFLFVFHFTKVPFSDEGCSSCEEKAKNKDCIQHFGTYAESGESFFCGSWCLYGRFGTTMALRRKLGDSLDFSRRMVLSFSRYYSSKKVDLKKMRPMILKRIQDRAKDYPVHTMIPVAEEVLNSRRLLIQGVSTLLKVIPVVACKFCPEVYIGDKGHLIQTCPGFKRLSRNRVHEWKTGRLRDVLVPIEVFHLRHMFQDVIKHDQRFDYDRVPAVVELCWQAGAKDDNLYSGTWNPESDCPALEGAKSLSPDELTMVANGTLRAWEALRNGVKKLLMVYPAKVCKDCSEVHVGPSGHKVRLCGVFKYQRWQGTHFWRKPSVDDLVPPNIVWRRQRQDPPVLLNEGKGYFGHAPASSSSRIVLTGRRRCAYEVSLYDEMGWF